VLIKSPKVLFHGTRNNSLFPRKKERRIIIIIIIIIIIYNYGLHEKLISSHEGHNCIMGGKNSTLSDIIKI
jgi:hypothetical protein